MENMTLAAPGGDISVWTLFWEAGFVVKLVMIGLLAASIWSWAIIIDKLIAFARMRAALDRFEQVFWSGQSLEELYRTLSERKTSGMGAIFVSAHGYTTTRTEVIRIERMGRRRRRGVRAPRHR